VSGPLGKNFRRASHPVTLGALAFPLQGTERPLFPPLLNYKMEKATRSGKTCPAGAVISVREPRVGARINENMGTLNRAGLDRLEKRELQLTLLAAVFVLVLAAGLAVLMYPLVFLHPVGNKGMLRAAFFGFCALTLLFVGYLLERQRTVRQLKQQLLEELERNATLQQQASVDLLQSMPDLNHFWDRLTMEYRRAMTMQRTLSLLLVRGKPEAGPEKTSDENAAWSDAAKAMSRKLRPSDSIYRLAPDLFALVLPETDAASAKRVAARLQEELQAIRGKHGKTFVITSHNYPEHVHSAHELEDIVKSLLPEQEEWETPTLVEKA